MEGGTEANPAATEEETTVKNAPESENVDEKSSPNHSEYDSAGSYSDGEENEVNKSRRGSSEGSVGLERESGDGQESVPARKVDDDEDKKNPQYIPKKGTFYEHDDRTADETSETPAVAEPEVDKDGKKKIWQDKKERWGHDRFNDSEQTPKSRAELVATYGYDIRNEEGPPRARRRRRYGRGPNKYTRNWEDEDAYNRPAPVPRAKKPPARSNQREEFPQLPQEAANEPENAVIENEDNPIPETNGNPSARGGEHAEMAPQSHDTRGPREQQRYGSGRVIKPKKEIKDSDYRGFTAKTRQVRNVRTEQRIVSKPPLENRPKTEFIHSQNYTNKNMHDRMQNVEKDMAKLNVQDGVYKGGAKANAGPRQGSVPPRLQNEQKGSKRYSSMRQRSLPESATPPFNQQSGYYPNEFSQQGQALLHQNPQIHPSTTQVPQIAPPPLAPLPPVPVTATPILQPPQFAAPFPQGTAFLQASVAPPPFLPQQTPQIINYVPSQPQFPQGFQGFQPPFNPVTQPDLYQPQPGITYYSTDHQITQRMVPQKRPKAAIPIVAPPVLDLKSKKQDEADAGSYESELIYEEQELGESSNVQEYASQH